MKNFVKIGSKGDTIIEILLSITVLSLVLSVSYALANKSAQSTRQAQERGEAQRLAEEQLELLRGYITIDQLWDTNECFREDDLFTPSNESDEPTSNINDCRNRGAGERYHTWIEKTPSENTYTVYVEWPNVKGGIDELTLSYKLPATGDIPETVNYVCSDGIDNDDDGFTDHSSVNPDNPDPDCVGPTGDLEITPLPDPIVDVVVKKIPQGPGNTTPSCSNPATQNKSIGVRLQGGSTNEYRNANPRAVFAGLEEGVSYIASLNLPHRYEVCGSPTQNITAGLPGTTDQLDFKIRPNCYSTIIGYNSYWAYGNRRTDLDGWYVTLNGHYPTWNDRFIAGHYSGIPGSFWYVYSGSVNWGNQSAYYWIWEAYWRSDPVYGNVCPS
ncbi:MAG: type II secretion system protein [Candidatus Saccharimonadales bacterium]